MGLLDDAVPGGSIAKPLIVALGTLLIGKMMSGGGSAPAQAQAPQEGGGSIGRFGGLLERLTNAGHGEAVTSWVGPGQNAPIPADKLGSALGQTTVSDLARSAGISEQELLGHLARVLPGVVDKLTPNGRIPSAAEIQTLLSR